MSLDNVRNIGISAHIDSGKTTLSERILFYTGKIHKIEEVRGKSGVGAKMDSMDLEKEKGITIKSASTFCVWKDYSINLIDTPGHIDFTIEVERSLRVLDGAILVLCSVAGVQPQSFTVDRQMNRYHIPRIAFINKMDRPGADPFKATQQLREKLHHNAHLISLPIGSEDSFEGVIDLLKMKAYYFQGENGEVVVEKEIPEQLLDFSESMRRSLEEAVADLNDRVAEYYLNDQSVPTEILRAAIRRATLELKFTPVMVGSALKNKGVQLLLDAVGYYLPNPTEVINEGLDQDHDEEKIRIACDPSKPFVGFAFKLNDDKYGQLTDMRIYSGTISKGDTIFNRSQGSKKHKVSRLVRMHSDESHEITSASAGDIVAFFGIPCQSGDTFCDADANITMTSMFVPSPVISLAIAPKKKEDLENLNKALGKFSKEDPTFKVHQDPESAETIISGMGELHLEIYVLRIQKEYNCEVIVGKPQVAFRETITKRAELNHTHSKQTGGAGQYARIVGYLEPLPDDAAETYEFASEVVGGSIPKEYIPACDKGFREQLINGPLTGFPVIGVRAVVVDGDYHDVDSSEMSFKICAGDAFKKAFAKADPVILEPIMKLQVLVPDEFQGQVIRQINQRRGLILSSASDGGTTTVDAEVPLTEMFGYLNVLRSATQGKGEFTMELSRYKIVPKNMQEELISNYSGR